MRVLARFFEEEGIGFRRNTLLQFGNSWDLIGSIFCINPGSAAPLFKELSSEDLGKIKGFYGEDIKSSEWKEFSVDNTMGIIERLFSGAMIGSTQKLNGVIQLFNLFNLRDQNLSKALKLYKEHQENPHISSWQEDVKLLKDKPVFLAWGNTGKNELNEISKQVFDAVENKLYLDSEFKNNSFYHPRYLQMKLYSNKGVVETIHHFINQNRVYVCDYLPEKIVIDYEEVFRIYRDKITKVIVDDIPNDPKVFRHFFIDKAGNKMNFTVACQSQEKKYLSVRYEDKTIDNEDEYYRYAEENGFSSAREKSLPGNWLFQIYFKDILAINEDDLSETLCAITKEIIAL